jgi:hypothetical protein
MLVKVKPIPLEYRTEKCFTDHEDRLIYWKLNMFGKQYSVLKDSEI